MKVREKDRHFFAKLWIVLILPRLSSTRIVLIRRIGNCISFIKEFDKSESWERCTELIHRYLNNWIEKSYRESVINYSYYNFYKNRVVNLDSFRLFRSCEIFYSKYLLQTGWHSTLICRRVSRNEIETDREKDVFKGGSNPISPLSISLRLSKCLKLLLEDPLLEDLYLATSIPLIRSMVYQYSLSLCSCRKLEFLSLSLSLCAERELLSNIDNENESIQAFVKVPVCNTFSCISRRRERWCEKSSKEYRVEENGGKKFQCWRNIRRY